MHRLATFFGLLYVAGCNRSDSGDDAATTTGITSVSAAGSTGSGSTGGSGTTATSVAEVSTSTGASTGSSGAVPDLGDVPDFSGGPPAGCQGKVDFLFVISREPNMAEAQGRLVTSFPGFIAAIQQLGQDFAAQDFHIMVVDGDGEWGLAKCNDDCTPEGCTVPDYPCGQLGLVDACDNTMGAGTIFNAGELASNEPCGLPALHRYLDGDHPTLLDSFTCLATVGKSGYGLIGSALPAAVSPALRDGCNQGFLRDDALLVVTFISGVDPDSKGTPEEWADAVFAAKHGDKNAVVMLGIHAFADLETCAEEDQGQLCRMLEQFPHRVFANVLVSDYSVPFQQAVGLIDVACEELVPQ